MEVAATWILSSLNSAAPPELENPRGFLEELVLALAPLHLPESELVRRARLEFVTHVGRLSRPDADPAAPVLELARLWCGQLLTELPTDGALKNAARLLQVSVPDDASLPRKEDDEAQPYRPQILSIPRHLSQEELHVEWELCLTDILGLKLDEVLERNTAQGVSSLGPDTPPADAAVTMYWAAQNIWDKYWQSGLTEFLPAARRFVEFAYAVHTLLKGEKNHRANTLQLALRFQLPALLRISPLEPMRIEAEPLFRVESCYLSLPILLTGIVQAVAGACRAAELAGDQDERDSLLTLHGEQLREIQKEYERVAKERIPAETDAWLYLSPLIDSLTGGDVPEASRVDPSFVKLVNRANHSDVLTYVATQLEQTINALAQKLTRHKLSGEHLIRPIGKLSHPGGQRPGQPLGPFENALRLLDSGDFERAAAEFEDLATSRRRPTLTSAQQNIARDYQAYALASWGKYIQAKPLLRGLCELNYTYSSAYWNLACIEAERQDQLRALEQGLQRAPNLNMLEAAVYISAILERRDDAQVCDWLSLMPFLEALILQYHHECTRLEDDEKGRRKRDDLLKRISAYIDHRDPIVPDPTDAGIASEVVVDLRDSLKQRDHLEAMGFWLRCHRPYETRFKDSRARTEYYKLRTDIWMDLGRPEEAARTFEEEIESHLGFLLYLLRDRTPEQLPRGVLINIRTRLERQLRSCMAPDLEPAGRKLYKRVREWENQRESKVVLILDGTPQRKIHEFYGGGVETLERVLVRVSGELRQGFHSISDYPRNRAALLDLLQALNTAGKEQGVKALQVQLEQWDRLVKTTNAAERDAAALDAQAAFGPLETRFQLDLTREQFEMANGILYAIRRVNGRHVPGPKIAIAPVLEARPSFRGDGRTSAFALRVTTDGATADVRIMQMVVHVEESECTFPLRDSLEAIPVVVRPGGSAILTFEDAGDFHASGPCKLEVEVTYEYLGQTQTSQAIGVGIEPIVRVPTAIPSPYIFKREILPDEIDGHFFGRDNEEQTIIALLRGASGRQGYIEGIRRTGKTSLFNGVRCRLTKEETSEQGNGVSLVPVLLKGGSVGAFSQVGQILHHFFREICLEPRIARVGVGVPDEEACCRNMMGAYREFERELNTKLPGHRVVAFWDDFQAIVDLAEDVGLQNPAFLVSTRALLEVIRDQRRAESPIVWLFAGFRPWMGFIKQVPRVNLWAELEAIPIDFLGRQAVQDIVARPLAGTPIVVMAETVNRVYEYTQGYPEVVQRMAESMLEAVQRENRYVMTPADVDAAAREAAGVPGLFAETWCPLAELTDTQRALIGAFISAVPHLGGRVAPHRLVGKSEFTETVRKDIDDLISRKILVRDENGATVGVRALVLEMWMRSHWKNQQAPLTAAVFIDVANLTKGSGNDELILDGVSCGDVVPGTFKLKTVLDAIDRYTGELVPSPVSEKWAINYPPGSRALQALNLNSYQAINLDPALFEKGKVKSGSDDTALQSQIALVTADRPFITHVVVVTGDRDFRMVAVDIQLKRGKSVHIVTHRGSVAPELVRLSQQYPTKCKVVYLEELVERHYLAQGNG